VLRSRHRQPEVILKTGTDNMAEGESRTAMNEVHNKIEKK
jgi:hypothetical protein